MRWPANEIDRGATLGHRTNIELAPSATDQLIESARTEFEPMYLPDALVTAVETAGCRLVGTRYFTDLFSDDPEVSITQKLESLFVGSVAHANTEFANDAYTHLHSRRGSFGIDTRLIKAMETAMASELKQGSLERHDRLSTAANSLGRPLRNRILGALASGRAMLAR
jgi:hypothetical protein